MKRFCLMLLAVVGGCAPLDQPRQANSAPFRQIADEFVATHCAKRPVEAVALGWHQYDGQWFRWDAAALAEEGARLRRFEQRLAREVAPGRLPAAERAEWRALQAEIAKQRWALEVQRGPWRNPMTYAGGLDVSVYLKRDFKPLRERVADMTSILRHAPILFADARALLEPVLPRPFVETAIEMAGGTASFIESDLTKAARLAGEAATVAEFEATSARAAAELRAFADWLRTERLPQSDSGYALGREGYRAMLRGELVDLDPEKILDVGWRELRAEQERFAAAARIIDPSRPPAEVFAAVQKEHPAAADLIPETRRTLEAIRQFIVERRLVTMPSEVRARVAETLPPFRATSFASMDTPGPFETKATEAYYYVTPVEPHWPPQQQEEWLTAFNYYTTDVVSIHEAYPGHYTQFLALNASPASTVAKVFGSYGFIEGWAHYTERMVLDAGFMQPANPATASRDDLVRAAKYRLAQSDEALLRLCRLCCSIRLHTQGMTVDEATRFFRDNCYYEEKPARSEAVRGTYDPGYLHYTLGKLQILKLRGDLQAQDGTAFSLQRFHDELLRHGAPPIRVLRELMLRDRRQWGAIL